MPSAPSRYSIITLLLDHKITGRAGCRCMPCRVGTSKHKTIRASRAVLDHPRKEHDMLRSAPLAAGGGRRYFVRQSILKYTKLSATIAHNHVLPVVPHDSTRRGRCNCFHLAATLNRGKRATCQRPCFHMTGTLAQLNFIHILPTRSDARSSAVQAQRRACHMRWEICLQLLPCCGRFCRASWLRVLGLSWKLLYTTGNLVASGPDRSR